MDWRDPDYRKENPMYCEVIHVVKKSGKDFAEAWAFWSLIDAYVTTILSLNGKKQTRSSAYSGMPAPDAEDDARSDFVRAQVKMDLIAMLGGKPGPAKPWTALFTRRDFRREKWDEREHLEMLRILDEVSGSNLLGELLDPKNLVPLLPED